MYAGVNAWKDLQTKINSTKSALSQADKVQNYLIFGYFVIKNNWYLLVTLAMDF